MRCDLHVAQTDCIGFPSPAQVYNPWDQIGLYGQDPGNDLQLSGTYYCAAGHSGQGAARVCRVRG